MRIPDSVLLNIYQKRGMSATEAAILLEKVRNSPPVDPGLTFPDIDNAADDSYFKNYKTN